MLWLWLACAGTGGGADTGASTTGDDTAAGGPPGRCEQTVAPGGTVAGEDDCTGGVCTVAAGAFVMGSPDAVHPDRCPERTVTLATYGINQTEVTQAAWAACVAAGACDEPPLCVNEAELSEPEETPVACVTWGQASDYCTWAGGRLPTEAEWEKAARGTDGATWAWGDTPPSCFTANFRFVSGYCEGGPVEVGRYAAPHPDNSTVDDTHSAFGLLDVVGNVWEWTADWYDADYGDSAPAADPPGPEGCSLHVGEDDSTCRYRVLRGGAFNSTEDVTQLTARSFADPEIFDVNIGFRCAWDL